MTTSTKWPHFEVTIRTLFAVVGGYAASAAFSILLAEPFDMERREQEVFIRMIFFVVYTTLIIWCFSINNTSKALKHMLGLNGILWLAYLLLIGAEK